MILILGTAAAIETGASLGRLGYFIMHQPLRKLFCPPHASAKSIIKKGCTGLFGARPKAAGLIGCV